MSEDAANGIPEPVQPDKPDQPDQPDQPDLGAEVQRLSQEAFRLAQRFVATSLEEVDLDRARHLNGRLDDLVAPIRARPSTERPALVEAWNDARLDLGYVLSQGELPTSRRLYYYIRDHQPGKVDDRADPGLASG